LADFDRSGRVDFGDLAFFAPNFNKRRSGGDSLVFPPGFPDAWQEKMGEPEDAWHAFNSEAAWEPFRAGSGTAGRQPPEPFDAGLHVRAADVAVRMGQEPEFPRPHRLQRNLLTPDSLRSPKDHVPLHRGHQEFEDPEGLHVAWYVSVPDESSSDLFSVWC
jgi:hypothetical protein